MSLLTKIERIERMHQMIKFKRTGTPEQFARRIGISRSMLYIIINDLKSIGAPIVYCKSYESFMYEFVVQFRFGFEHPSLPKDQLRKVGAGCRIVSIENVRNSFQP